MEATADFERRFGVKPKWTIECPGRVNLIGEHIDYHGYSVLPMALEVKTTLVVGPIKENEIRFENVSPSFSPHRESLPSPWKGASPPAWYDYLLAGWKGALDEIKAPQAPFAVLMDSSIPASAGLSSSSSLVCASALATLTVATDGKPFEKMTKSQIAELCMVSEQLIGTAGGGMDQAAECLCEDGRALVISFNPLRTRPISLPSGAVFVVADSRERKNKAASNEFNSRVVEGRIGAVMLSRNLNVTNWKDMRKLIDVEKAAGLTTEQLLKEVEKLPEKLTAEEARSELGEVFDSLLTGDTKNVTSFVIRRRIRHVYSEAHRVDLFASACEEGQLTKMGELMDESHRSCSADYECSTPTLDSLVASLKQAGALGARLTGAGWGGAVVALFNAQFFGAGDCLANIDILFHSKPSAGIRIHNL